MLSGLDPIACTACKAVAISQSDAPETIAEQGKLMESYGADVVLVTDSAGALMPDTVKQRVAALRSALKISRRLPRPQQSFSCRFQQRRSD